MSTTEFVRLIRDFTEEGGYFLSDNFTSSEDSYLTIVDKMKELGATGGAYIGAGPEQNFTYIAKVRPRIAFIVDIRRQAMIQHQMYKAIFRLSPTRAHFLSRLLSRPMPAGNDVGANASLDEIRTFFTGIPADNRTYAENLAAIRKTIQEDFQFSLSAEDQASLEYVYKNFHTWGFEVGFDQGYALIWTSGHECNRIATRSVTKCLSRNNRPTLLRPPGSPARRERRDLGLEARLCRVV